MEQMKTVTELNRELLKTNIAVAILDELVKVNACPECAITELSNAYLEILHATGSLIADDPQAFVVDLIEQMLEQVKGKQSNVVPFNIAN